MSIGTFCRDFRQQNNVPLSHITKDKALYKTLYSFECGRSTNYNHIKHYLNLSVELYKKDIFTLGLLKELSL